MPKKAKFILTSDEDFPKNEINECSICMSEFEGNEKKGDIVQFPCHNTHSIYIYNDYYFLNILFLLFLILYSIP